MNESTGQIAIYQTADGRTQIDVKVNQDTLWLTLLQMAELFDRDKSVISRHLKNIFDTGELSREATVAKTAKVQSEGGRQVGREVELCRALSRYARTFQTTGFPPAPHMAVPCRAQARE